MNLSFYRQCLPPFFTILFCLSGCQYGGEAQKQRGQAWIRSEEEKLRKSADKDIAAAEQGNAIDQWFVGLRYNMGTGVAKDKAEAVKWWRKSAEQGFVPAQCDLGVCYYTGSGVVKDEAEAAKLFRKAAEQGNAFAQCHLGLCYAMGNGVMKNNIEGYKWFLLSLAMGYDSAKQNVSVIERDLSPNQRAEGQRLATAWQAKFEEAHPAKKLR